MHRTVGGILVVLTLTGPIGGGEVTAAAETMTPLERVASTPKGQLKSPYPDFANVAEEGHRKYMGAGCTRYIGVPFSLAWISPRWSRCLDFPAQMNLVLDILRMPFGDIM